MSEVTRDVSAQPHPSLIEECAGLWRALPDKGVFLTLLAAWLLLFQCLGNSTLGYIDTSSLFGWLHYVYENSADDQHGYLIPLVVLALYIWKRETLMNVVKRNWWPALFLVAGGLLLHVMGYVVQQTRVSVVGFFLGLYGLTGLVWGPQWLRATFFPFFLFAFCVPLATLSEPITFPLRMVATKITGWLNAGVLGINVVCSGTQIYESNYAYKYEVAAACSGIRSLTAIFVMALIYSFVAFTSPWKRLLMIGSAFPLAVLANVVRLTMVIVASEMGGQERGEWVHNNEWLSLLPYLPAVGGLFLLGWWLRERDGEDDSTARPRVAQPA